MVLIYDFDDSSLITEISLPANCVEHGISMISTPNYFKDHLILCGVGSFAYYQYINRSSYYYTLLLSFIPYHYIVVRLECCIMSVF